MTLSDLYDLRQEAAPGSEKARRIERAIAARTALIGADFSNLRAAHAEHERVVGELRAHHPELFE